MKKALALLLAGVMMFALCACGQTATQSTNTPAANNGGTSGKPEAAPASTEVIELVVGGVTSSSAKDAVTFFGEKLKEYSNGTLVIVDFPDNQLGDDAQRFEMTQTGECDISIGSTASVAATYKDFYVYDVPYLFLSKQEVYDIGFNGEAGLEILNGLEELGLKGLAMWENGFRNLTTNNTVINGVADLSGLKIRTMDNPIHLAAWKAMGANPTPMAFSELFTAMQQGTVDGEENPLGIITGNKFYEVEKFCYVTEHAYSPYYVVMNLDRYNSLTAEQQEALNKAMAEATKYQYEMSQKYEDDAVAEMEAAGCTVTVLSVEQKQEYKEAADKGDCLTLAKGMMTHPELADKMNDELIASRG